MAKYTEGIMEDGAAILKDGVPISVGDILNLLNSTEELKEYLKRKIKRLERERNMLMSPPPENYSIILHLREKELILKLVLIKIKKLEGER